MRDSEQRVDNVATGEHWRSSESDGWSRPLISSTLTTTQMLEWSSSQNWSNQCVDDLLSLPHEEWIHRSNKHGGECFLLTHKIKSNKRSNLEAILVQNYTLLAKRETPTGNLVLVISRENQFHFFLAQPWEIIFNFSFTPRNTRLITKCWKAISGRKEVSYIPESWCTFARVPILDTIMSSSLKNQQIPQKL